MSPPSSCPSLPTAGEGPGPGRVTRGRRAARLVRAPARPADLLVRGAHVLDPRTGLDGPHDVLVRDGEIAEIGAAGSLTRDRRRRDRSTAPGRHLFPAFVDPHVHLRTPGQEHKEDLETGTRSAAAGGYCAIVAMPNTSPVVDSAPILGALLDAAAREARVPVGFTAAITRGLQGARAHRDGRAARRSARPPSPTTAGRSPTPASSGARCSTSACAAASSRCTRRTPRCRARARCTRARSRRELGVAGIPSVSESTMIARDCALAEYEGARIHIQHLSARESVEVIAAAKARGVQVTCEASPHHLTMTDADVRGLDTRRKMNPPLRSESDRQALIEGLRDGTIDCIATDHAPHARDEKEVPFEQAPMGTTGLETAFASVYTDLVVPGDLDARAGRREADIGARAARSARADDRRSRRNALQQKKKKNIQTKRRPASRPLRASTPTRRPGPRSRSSSRGSPRARPASTCSSPRSRSASRRTSCSSTSPRSGSWASPATSPLGELLLRGPDAARQGAADRRGGRRRLPRAVDHAERGMSVDRRSGPRRSLRVRPARGRHALRRHRVRRAGRPRPARSSSRPACRATRSPSPTRASRARSSRSRIRTSATTACPRRRWSPSASGRAR